MSMIIDGTNGLTFNNATTQASAGCILQVVSATTSTNVSSSTNTYVDTTLTGTITPKFATSKILVLVNQNGVGRNGSSIAEDMKIKLVRNSTDIAGMYQYAMYTGTALPFRGGTYSLSYLDSPATTSATTYKTQFAAAENAGTVQVQQDAGNSVSTITLMEIAG
jgi:hypothetical protein